MAISSSQLSKFPDKVAITDKVAVEMENLWMEVNGNIDESEGFCSTP